jgi:predicted heme/steroid binding protein
LKRLDEKELKKHDGSAPSDPIYIAFKGKVYDVTSSPLFLEGMHFEHYAGCDLTEYLSDAPHGEEVFAELTVVGELVK